MSALTRLLRRVRLARRGIPNDRGSATVVLTGVVVLLLVLTVGFATVSRALIASERAAAAADEAALAGASVLLSPIGGQEPCEAARRVAQENHASLGGCAVLTDSVQLSVSVPGPVWWTASARARAGADGDSAGSGVVVPEVAP